MTTPTDRNTEQAKEGLFEDLPEPSQAQVLQAQTEATRKQAQGKARLLEPNRSQIELRASDLESLLPEVHRARLVWGYVVRQDLRWGSPVSRRACRLGKPAQQTRRVTVVR